MHRLLITLLAAAALAPVAGCDGEREPPPDVKDTIFDEQVKALDKAKAVEGVQDEHMQKLREAEQAQAGGD